MNADIVESRLMSKEAELIKAVRQSQDMVSAGRLMVKEITSTYNSGKDDRFTLSAMSIGKSLSKLGFTNARTSNSDRAIAWDESMINELEIRYGLKPFSKVEKENIKKEEPFRTNKSLRIVPKKIIRRKYNLGELVEEIIEEYK